MTRDEIRARVREMQYELKDLFSVVNGHAELWEGPLADDIWVLQDKYTAVDGAPAMVIRCISGTNKGTILSSWVSDLAERGYKKVIE